MPLTEQDLDDIEAHVARIQSHFGQTLAVSLTNRCPLRCAHCCVAAGRDVDLTNSLVDRLCRELGAVCGTVRTISLTGGEPLLMPEVVSAIARASRTHGLSTGVVTSACWAGSRAQAEAVVQTQPDVDSYDISTDIYHLEFVPWDNIRNAFEVARELGKRVIIRLTDRKSVV